MAITIVEWKEEYNLDISSIDNQHKKIVDMIFNVQRSLIEGTSVKLLQKQIKEMVSFTISHLEYEESIFSKINYSHTDVHIQEHDLLRKKATKFQNTLDDKEKSKRDKHKMTIEIMNFFTSWFVGHIIEADRQYKNDFKKAEIK